MKGRGGRTILSILDQMFLVLLTMKNAFMKTIFFALILYYFFF